VGWGGGVFGGRGFWDRGAPPPPPPPPAYDRLRVLHTALEPLHTSAGVAELRERLHATVA
jgi:hypothetical protein